MGAMLSEIAAQICPIRIVDASGNVVYQNQLFDEHIGAHHFSGDEPDLIEIIQQLEVLNRPLQYHVRIQHHDRVAVFQSNHRLVKLKRGAVPLVISEYRDVGREDMLQNRLMLTQNRLDDLTKLTADWVWETDADLRLTLASQRIQEILGFHSRELAGAHIFKLGAFESAEIDPVTQLPMAVQRLTPFRNLRMKIIDRHGKHHILHLSGMPNFDRAGGQFTGYRGTATDITAQLEAQRQAELMERRLAHAIESISEGFSLFDGNGRLVMINQVFKNFYPNTEHLLIPGMLKRDWLEQAVLRGDVITDGIAARDWIDARIEHWEVARRPIEVKLADGRHLLIQSYKTDDDGRVSIHTDITAIKKRELELIEAREHAEDANKAKGEFFAKMSHELRTPLNAIIGFSGIMRDEKLGGLGVDQYKTYCHDIHDSATHLLNIINDILDVSKAEVGKLQLSEQNVSVISVVQSTMRMLSEKSRELGVRVESDAVDADLVLRADHKKMRQILINLLSNALKFTPSGGVVKIQTAIDASGNAVIQLRDTGIGIKPEDIEKALTPFAQIDHGMARKNEGTGLGLPLSAALAELHGGKLELESAPGVGTTVSVIMPKSRVVSQRVS